MARKADRDPWMKAGLANMRQVRTAPVTPDPNRCELPTCGKRIDRSRAGRHHQRFCCDAHRRKWHHQNDKQKWIAYGMELARKRGGVA